MASLVEVNQVHWNACCGVVGALQEDMMKTAKKLLKIGWGRGVGGTAHADGGS